jgi:hypothetical protein
MATATTTAQQAELEHLELVQALSRAISAAVAAIERNNLEELLTAIANQEEICHELISRKWSRGEMCGTNTDAVQQAYMALSQINRIYAGVIKRSRRFADLLSSVYGASDKRYGKELPILVERQPWTCEA